MVCESPDRLCRNDSTACVKIVNVCDGHRDCLDGSDEGGICGENYLLLLVSGETISYLLLSQKKHDAVAFCLL